MNTSIGDLRPHPTRADLIIAALLTALLGYLAYLNHVDGPTMGPAEGGPVFVSAWAVAAAPLVMIPALWRTSAPLLALAATTLALLVFQLAAGPLVLCGVMYPVFAVLAYAAGARTIGRWRWLALALAAGAAVAVGLSDGVTGTLVVGGPVVLFALGAGMITAGRGRLIARLREQNVELAQTRDERARLEVATHRATLSGDLDLLLRGRLAELTLLADQARSLTAEGGSDPGPALAQIESDSRRTLEEMRRLVGALRSSDGSATTAPMPTLTSLDALLVQLRGPDTQLVVRGDPRSLPPGVELSAYRIVEHLLGALEDAPGTVVRVDFGADVLALEVRGRAGRRGEFASGLARARERVELHQGTLSSTNRGGRAAAVATLPTLQGA